MAKSTLKRRKVIRSYAGFTTGAAVHMIRPMTENAARYAREILESNTGVVTGNLRQSLTHEVNATSGVVKCGRGGNHVHLIEYGVSPFIPAQVMPIGGDPKYIGIHPGFKGIFFMRKGAAKARREMRKFWRQGLKEAEREQSTGA